MRTFEKVKKRYVLNNSYFKNIGQEEPQRPIEVMGYVSQYSELPYREVMTDRWIYDCYVEYQKRCGVVLDQFFTPPAVAHQVYELAKICFDDSGSVLDAFCGFGMLSREMREEGFDVEGFDIDEELCELYEFNTGCKAYRCDYKDFDSGHRYKSIVSNPPFDGFDKIIKMIYDNLEDDGMAILILPTGLLDRRRPKTLVQALERFDIVYRESAVAGFARTKTSCEICVLKKR